MRTFIILLAPVIAFGVIIDSKYLHLYFKCKIRYTFIKRNIIHIALVKVRPLKMKNEIQSNQSDGSIHSISTRPQLYNEL